jgi:hypothetical protein
LRAFLRSGIDLQCAPPIHGYELVLSDVPADHRVIASPQSSLGVHQVKSSPTTAQQQQHDNLDLNISTQDAVQENGNGDNYHFEVLTQPLEEFIEAPPTSSNQRVDHSIHSAHSAHHEPGFPQAKQLPNDTNTARLLLCPPPPPHFFNQFIRVTRFSVTWVCAVQRSNESSPMQVIHVAEAKARHLAGQATIVPVIMAYLEDVDFEPYQCALPIPRPCVLQPHIVTGNLVSLLSRRKQLQDRHTQCMPPICARISHIGPINRAPSSTANEIPKYFCFIEVTTSQRYFPFAPTASVRILLLEGSGIEWRPFLCIGTDCILKGLIPRVIKKGRRNQSHVFVPHETLFSIEIVDGQEMQVSDAAMAMKEEFQDVIVLPHGHAGDSQNILASPRQDVEVLEDEDTMAGHLAVSAASPTPQSSQSIQQEFAASSFSVPASTDNNEMGMGICGQPSLVSVEGRITATFSDYTLELDDSVRFIFSASDLTSLSLPLAELAALREGAELSFQSVHCFRHHNSVALIRCARSSVVITRLPPPLPDLRCLKLWAARSRVRTFLQSLSCTDMAWLTLSMLKVSWKFIFMFAPIRNDQKAVFEKILRFAYCLHHSLSFGRITSGESTRLTRRRCRTHWLTIC